MQTIDVEPGQGSKVNAESNAAPWSRSLATVLLAGVLPVLMIVANRSSAVVLIMAAAVSLVAVILEAGMVPLARLAPMRWRDPVIVIALAALAWAHLSIVWSLHPGLSLGELYGLLLPLLAAIALHILLVARAPAWTAYVLLGGFIVAVLAAWIELEGHFPLTHMLGKRTDASDFNRPTLTLFILFWPLVALLGAHKKPLIGAAVFALMLVTVGFSHSGTSVVALGLSIGAYLVARVAPRASIAVAAGVVVLSFALAPWIGQVADRIVPAALVKAASNVPEHGFHTKERIALWKSYGAVVQQQPIRGVGFGASRWTADEPIAQRIPEALRGGLAYPHPHDMFLQVWVETGLVGVVLVGGLLLAGLHRLSRLPAASIPTRFALVVGALCIAEFSHGAWQAWWIAALGAAWVLFDIAQRARPSLPPARDGGRSTKLRRNPHRPLSVAPVS